MSGAAAASRPKRSQLRASISAAIKSRSISCSGSSLRANNLRVVDTVLTSTPRFIANRDACKDEWKSQKMARLILLLEGAIRAASRAGLMMNVPKAALAQVLGQLPALNSPTVSTLDDEAWVALNTVVEESQAKDLIPRLREAGARGIVEYPLTKIVD